jgi:hypothetical protein
MVISTSVYQFGRYDRIDLLTHVSVLVKTNKSDVNHSGGGAWFVTTVSTNCHILLDYKF